jgi:DNA invertase Pin-like site-specific DNA recombinase
MAYQKIKRKAIRFWTKKKAALYVRVSTRYQIDKDSLPFQRKKLKEYCKFLEMEDFVIFEDDGYSAKNTDRPRFQEMMNRIRNGEFSHVIVWKVDRISRNLLDFAAMYDELKDHKVTFISMNEQFDTSTAIGEAMLKIILIFAELERNMTSERVTGIMLDRAENGLWNGARMPVGYRWNPETKFPEPDPEEQKIVQYIFDEYERVRSCLKIARSLNNNQVRSKRGGSWTSKLIHDIIRNPFYIGTYRYNMREAGRGPLKPESEWIVRENNHQGIIQKEQFERCNKIMDENGTSRNTSDFRAQKYVHTFSGRLVCAKCGANMIASKDRSRANGWRPSMYRCAQRSRMLNCDNSRTVNEGYIGPFVFNYVANLARIQKNFKSIKTLERLEKELLKGPEFKGVTISRESLQRTFDALAFREVGKGTYLPDIISGSSDDYTTAEQLSLLKNEREKCKTAITRLTDLYLYDPDSMTKEEFSAKKKELIKKITDLESQIESFHADSGDDLADLEFIRKASAFLVAQRIISKKHIDYMQMALELDNEILKDFIEQVVDRIIIRDGRVEKIRFVNGLEHEFYYSTPAELPLCQKCGGRIGSTVGCRMRTFNFEGKSYRRLKFGEPGDDFSGKAVTACPECAALFGRWHHWKCGIERCPICGEHLVTCPHGSNK